MILKKDNHKKSGKRAFTCFSVPTMSNLGRRLIYGKNSDNIVLTIRDLIKSEKMSKLNRVGYDCLHNHNGEVKNKLEVLMKKRGESLNKLVENYRT